MKLWKENRIDKEWELSNEQIIAQFKDSYHWKNKDNYRSYDTAFRCFITDNKNNGLNSVFEENEIQDLFESDSYGKLLEIE